MDKLITVSSSFVLEAHNSACSKWKARIEQEFPDLFVNKIEVGKWYKIEDGYLFCITDIEDCTSYKKISYYGFYPHWREDYFASNRLERQMVLATSEEVKTALIKEANRRGVWNVPILNNRYPCFEEVFDYVNNVLWSTYGRVFDKGKWVTIIEQPTEMTLAEIEAKLGHSIKIVK